MADYTPDEFNTVVQTVAGEAGNQPPEGQAAVASTILNRHALTGEPIGKIASDPSIYNGAATSNARAAVPGSSVYQTVSQNIAPVFTKGPTTSATHFHSAMPQPPAWDNGTGQKVGDLTFLDRSDLLKAQQGDTPAGDQPAPAAAGPTAADLEQHFSQDAQKPAAMPYDASLGVHRNPDGSISGVGSGVAVGVEGQPQVPNVLTDQKTIQRFLANHPEDVANHMGGPPSADDLEAHFNVGAAPGQAPDQPDSGTDILKSLGSGLVQGVTGLNALVPLSSDQIASGANTANWISEHLGGKPIIPMQPGMDPFGRPTSQGMSAELGGNYQPQTTGGKYAQTIGQFAPNAALGGEGVLAKAASVVLPALGSEAAGQLADAAGAPAWGQTAARIVGGVGAGLAPSLLAGAARSAGHALGPYAARFSQAAAENQAGHALAGAASDLPATRSALANGPTEIVPGSPPTTFQQTADTGLGALERGVAARNPAAFADVRGQQNAARVQALGTIQSGADPAEVSNYLKARFDDIDSATEAALQAARAKGAASIAATDDMTGHALTGLKTQAQGAASALGGSGTPEAYGAEVRGAITDAQKASKASYRKLYDAIDPEGKLTANVVGTKQAASEIVAGEPATAAPMSADEAGVFRAADAMPDVAPARDLMALKVRVNDVASAEMRDHGPTATYARLTRLKGAIEDNIAKTISDKVTSDNAAVAAGQMAPEQAMGAGFAADVQKWQEQRVQARRAVGQGDSGTRPNGTPAVSGNGGAKVQGGGEPANVAGNPSLPPDAIVPTFDGSAAGRLKAADTAYAQHARTFGIQAVDQSLKTKGYAGDFRLPDGSVPGKFFHPGPTGYTDMQALQKAAGPAAMPVIEDYAASSLKKAAGNPDGTIDPAKFARWKAAHSDALRALPPETSARFADAASASGAVADAAVARDTAVKATQASALKDVMNAEADRKAALSTAQAGPAGQLMKVSDPQDISKTLGAVLGSKSAVTDMRGLANAVRDNPDAVAGLRQAVADNIASRFLGNTEAGTSGVAQIKADGYQTFMRQNREALATVFSPEEIDTMDKIAADIRRSKLSETALKIPGGSNTAQDTIAAGAPKGHSAGRPFLDALGGILGAAAGHHFAGVLGGEIGMGLGGGITDTVQMLRVQGIQRVDQLITRAMIDPKVAKVLLDRVPESAGKASSAGFDTKLRALAAALSASRHASLPDPTPRKDVPLLESDIFQRMHALTGLKPGASPTHALSGY